MIAHSKCIDALPEACRNCAVCLRRGRNHKCQNTNESSLPLCNNKKGSKEGDDDDDDDDEYDKEEKSKTESTKTENTKTENTKTENTKTEKT